MVIIQNVEDDILESTVLMRNFFCEEVNTDVKIDRYLDEPNTE